MSRETIGWTLYAVVMCWILWRGWKQARESDRQRALLDEMRRREHDRPKPPRRFVSGVGNKGEYNA